MPELLDLIFGCLGHCDNASNARVCRVWSDVALDLLWREVDDLPRVFQLLAPIGTILTREVSLRS